MLQKTIKTKKGISTSNVVWRFIKASSCLTSVGIYIKKKHYINGAPGDFFPVFAKIFTCVYCNKISKVTVYWYKFNLTIIIKKIKSLYFAVMCTV